jgi:hypothetical protein
MRSQETLSSNADMVHLACIRVVVKTFIRSPLVALSAARVTVLIHKTNQIGNVIVHPVTALSPTSAKMTAIKSENLYPSSIAFDNIMDHLWHMVHCLSVRVGLGRRHWLSLIILL